MPNSAWLILLGSTILIFGALLATHEQTQHQTKIAELNEQIAKSITGGDSYCYLDFRLMGADANRPTIVVVHRGKYPIYELNARIVDLQKTAEIREAKGSRLTLDDVKAADTSMAIGQIAPTQARILTDWQLPDRDEQDYNIFFSARNGFFTQLVRFRRHSVMGYRVQATKVFRGVSDDGKTLLEKVDPGFPLDAQGKVEWNKKPDADAKTEDP